jgi:RNA polymerase sigma factor for flagellar operon FliA
MDAKNEFNERSVARGDGNVADGVAQWLSFVKCLARQTYRLAPRGESLDDLEGDGFEALLRALDSFDATKGGTPESWITLKVRGAMIDGMRRRHPGPYRKRPERERLGPSAVKFVSFDAPAGPADPGLTLGETLADGAEVLVEEQVEERDQLDPARRRVRAALGNLSKREKRLLLLRHVEELSVGELAAREGVTERRIYQIERAAAIKVRGESSPDAAAPSDLSGIELKVLQSTAAGDTAAETAKRLGRSIETVRTHRKAVVKKLRARNMCHALSKAYRLGILP